MIVYWLTLAITDVELARAMAVEISEIEDGDYIGFIRSHGEVVELREVES